MNEFALPLPQLTAASDHAPDPLFAGPLSLITWPIMMIAAGMALYTISGARRSSSPQLSMSKQ
ncbi:hypothetical protein ACFXPS_42225 [Nocardia sp. NPDC059091]|uniref:hypothetical protein n=1 Tax=unclassified Nocardia TaxID=2637762 RepID=UPI0036CF2EA4